jgi:hypothetical protein
LFQAVCTFCVGAKNGFFCQLVDSVVDNFGGFYPELRANRDKVLNVPIASSVPACVALERLDIRLRR